jgi:hypothetical protein
VTTTISPPVRILAIVGVVAAIGLGAFILLNRDSSSNTAAPVTSTPTTPRAARTVTPATGALRTASTKPARVTLLPGLPSQVAHALRFSKVAVVTVYARGADGDRAALTQARKGAKAVHAGFVAINVAGERNAKLMGAFAGLDTAPPAILVVKRPGKIVNRFDGSVDHQIVAQAARNAGAAAR